MFAEQVVVKQPALAGDLRPCPLLSGIVRGLNSRVKFIVGHVIHGIDLACSPGDCGETTRQGLKRYADQVRLTTTPVTYHLVVLMPDVLYPVGAYCPFTRDGCVQQR